MNFKNTVLFIFLIGCRESSTPPSSDRQTSVEIEVDHRSEKEGSTYEEGKGISLLKETEESLGVEIAEVTENPIQSTLRITAQVYRSALEKSKKQGGEQQGNAYASALLSSEIASTLPLQTTVHFGSSPKSAVRPPGIVWKINSAQSTGLEKTEILLELPDPEQSLKVRDFIELDLLSPLALSAKLSIPPSARLKTSTGSYAFVKNGSFLLRTEIKTGIESKDWIEILEGLYEGDQIATKPIEELYMIELRATKGGGHCH